MSQASAKQRAGRAGRTGPGRVLRLYAMEDYLRRPEHDLPEILRSDLSQLVLTLRAMQIGDTKERLGDSKEIDWLDAPPAAAVERAESLLDRLGDAPAIAEPLFDLGRRFVYPDSLRSREKGLNFSAFGIRIAA